MTVSRVPACPAVSRTRVSPCPPPYTGGHGWTHRDLGFCSGHGRGVSRLSDTPKEHRVSDLEYPDEWSHQ